MKFTSSSRIVRPFFFKKITLISPFIADSYCLVTGVSSDSKDPQTSAANLVSLALTFCRAVKEVDVTGQIVDSVQIRVGVHSGSAFGGVPNPAFPKFSLLGDATTVSSILEQTSRPNAVHISGATHELVKDKFEFDVSESILFKNHRISTFWALENINQGKKKRGGKGSRAAAQ
jgi:class 3 adenylate cyclase